MGQMSTEDRLVYMANQIAITFRVAGDAAAAAATADHIATFWDPRMRSHILAQLAGEAAAPREGGILLSPIARRAIELLRDRGASQHQTRATSFAQADQVGGSDAG